jgi:hypothetical protein
MSGRDTADLEKLAVELAVRGFPTTITTPDGRPPYLTAQNPDTSALSVMILADQGLYWWSWAERIGPASDVASAASRIAHVLAGGPDGAA